MINKGEQDQVKLHLSTYAFMTEYLFSVAEKSDIALRLACDTSSKSLLFWTWKSYNSSLLPIILSAWKNMTTNILMNMLMCCKSVSENNENSQAYDAIYSINCLSHSMLLLFYTDLF